MSAEAMTAFSPQHVLALLVIAAVGVLLAAVARRASAARRLALCRGLALLLMANMAFEQFFELAAGRWSVQHSLPLHLCDVALLVVAAALWGPGSVDRGGSLGKPAQRQFLYEVAYYWGLGGTLQALLTPDTGGDFPHPLYFTYFTAHGSIVIGVAVLTLGWRRRPGRGSAVRAWLLTNLLGAVVLPVNLLLDSNYMFLCGPPEQPTVLDLLGTWPWPFLVALDALAAVLIALCYLPFWVMERRAVR